MKILLNTLVVFLVLTAMPAFAQEARPGSVAVAAVKELLVAIHFKEDAASSMLSHVKLTMPQSFQEAVVQRLNSEPGMSPADKRAAAQRIDNAVVDMLFKAQADLSSPALLEEMAVAMVPVYARHFSVDEIRQMATFYRTPVGQKLLSTRGDILVPRSQQEIKIVDDYLDKILPQALEKVIKP